MKKIFFAVISIGILCFLLFYFYPALIFKPFFVVKNPQSKYPLIYLVPTETKISDSISVSGQTYKINNLQFKTSFGEPIMNKTSTSGDTLVLRFSDDKTVLVVKEPNVSPNSAILNFDYYNGVANTTPSQLSIFDNKSSFTYKWLNLITKLAIFLNVNSESFYKFNTQNVRGFQTGTPGQDNVALVVFDKNDTMYTIVFNKNVSQNEIDAVVFSIQ